MCHIVASHCGFVQDIGHPDKYVSDHGPNRSSSTLSVLTKWVLNDDPNSLIRTDGIGIDFLGLFYGLDTC